VALFLGDPGRAAIILSTFAVTGVFQTTLVEILGGIWGLVCVAHVFLFLFLFEDFLFHLRDLTIAKHIFKLLNSINIISLLFLNDNRPLFYSSF
jgi:hypothetical protein